VQRAGPVGAGGSSGFWLEWEQAGVRSRLPLSRPLTIGRDASCDVRLAEPTVSRHHAVVSIVGGGPFVDASTSTNGITLDRGRANQVALSPGQSFRIGSTVFRVMGAPTAAAQVPQPMVPGAHGRPVPGRPPVPPVAYASRSPRTQGQSLLPLAAIGAVGLVLVLAISGVALFSGGSGASSGAPGVASTDGTGITPRVASSAWALDNPVASAIDPQLATALVALPAPADGATYNIHAVRQSGDWALVMFDDANPAMAGEGGFVIATRQGGRWTVALPTDLSAFCAALAKAPANALSQDERDYFMGCN
jgi:hypothetical protein